MIGTKLVKWTSTTAKHFMNLEYKYGCHNYGPIAVVLSKGLGAEVWDVNGKKYYDLLSAAVNQGHCHPKIKAAAIAQMERITLTSRAFYSDRLCTWEKYLTTLLGYDKVCFQNGGVEAIEMAVKFARRWGYVVKGIPDKARVLFPKDNFWGRSIAACGSSDDPKRYKNFGPFDLKFGLVEYNNASALEEEFKKDPYICAYILEPIQGDAGVIIPSKGYLTKVRELCTKYNVLMAVDECQTGLGRVGRMLACDYEGVKPDMIALGKSLSGGFYPISACLGNDNVFDCIRPGDHGSTFGGNPLASAIGVVACQVVIDEKLSEQAVTQGDYLRDNLKDICGQGLLIGMEYALLT